MGKKTHFLPDDKLSGEEIFVNNGIAGTEKFFIEVFGAMTGIGAILNKNRQIIYANNEFLALFGIASLESALGKKPGDLVSCLHSGEKMTGCGTSAACSYCGIINTFLESQETGKRITREARISSIKEGKHKSYDMNVISVPVTFNDEVLYIMILQDISESKRRAALERIFFHDLLNSVGGLYGLLTVLKEETNPEQSRELIDLSEEASRNIIEEILVQRQIRAAEEEELIVKIEPVNSIELLESAIRKLVYQRSGKETMISRDEKSADVDFETDKVLLQRVIINLLKNAMEANNTSDPIYTGVKHYDEKVIFWVMNSQVIPDDIQMQLFNRSFSTKGIGRGLGTYSIRLLTENFLKGKVTFTSNKIQGTIFNIELNRIFHG